MFRGVEATASTPMPMLVEVPIALGVGSANKSSSLSSSFSSSPIANASCPDMTPSDDNLPVTGLWRLSIEAFLSNPPPLKSPLARSLRRCAWRSSSSSAPSTVKSRSAWNSLWLRTTASVNRGFSVVQSAKYLRCVCVTKQQTCNTKEWRCRKKQYGLINKLC